MYEIIRVPIVSFPSSYSFPVFSIFLWLYFFNCTQDNSQWKGQTVKKSKGQKSQKVVLSYFRSFRSFVPSTFYLLPSQYPANRIRYTNIFILEPKLPGFPVFFSPCSHFRNWPLHGAGSCAVQAARRTGCSPCPRIKRRLARIRDYPPPGRQWRVHRKSRNCPQGRPGRPL